MVKTGTPAEASRRPAPLALKAIRDSRWQVQAMLGRGRVMDFPAENMRLELFLPPWNNPPGRIATQAVFDTAVQGRHGLLLADGEAAVWCLLGGVPRPSFEATAEEREMRLGVALARAPAELTGVLGPLTSMRLVKADEADASAASSTTAALALGDDAVEMMVRVTREDVTVYARASALPELWLQLLASMASMSSMAPRAMSPEEDGLTVSVAVAIASGRIAANLLNRLRVGDVVRLGTSFDTAGRGQLRFGDVGLDVQWRARSPHNVFEVLGLSTSSTIRASSPGPSEFASMNPEYTDATAEEAAANGLLDDPQDTYRWSSDVGMDEPADEAPLAGAPAVPDASALENLPVTLVAEIGALTMTLGQLRTMKPGMLIKLGTRGGEEVVLRAVDGPPLAYAELVDIGGHVGMQVTKIAAP